MTKLQVVGIREQDIDLLLWEELVASPEFLSWFLAEIGFSGDLELAGVARSLWTATGESDLELDVRRGSDRLRVLVENKVDATLQPNQAERYRERAREYINRGECTISTTAIVAPAGYFGDDDDSLGFDHRISYERVLMWFEDATSLGPRRECKLALLREALDNGAWTLKPDRAATEFWRLYWERASAIAPQLRMAEPRDRPATSGFINFRPLELAPGVSLLHKVPYGNVDLQFAGMGSRAVETRERYLAHLEPDMAVEPANKSAVVRIAVPRISMSAPFSASAAAVDAGINAAARLLNLYKRGLA